MSGIWKALCSPGARKDVVSAAPTQVIWKDNEKDVSPLSSTDNIQGLEIKAKPRLLDRWLDIVVQAAGSQIVFFGIFVGLLVWAFLGIPFYDSVDWQVVISDVQAILCYIFDSLLMRQQLNTYDEGIAVAAQLQSRGLSHVRMLEKVKTMLESGEIVRSDIQSGPYDRSEFAVDLPKESWFGRLTTRFSVYFGHIVTIVIYWATILIWIGFGPANGWGDEWLLYMNSATSALMVFTFAFLANIRERHSVYAKKRIDATFQVDSALERKLRDLTDDRLYNDGVVIPAPKVNFVQRAIYYYAEVVGTLVGIALLFAVIIAWLAIGPVLEFNANWWLIIGTYAGLIGLHDGFILLNVQEHLRDHETTSFNEVEALDTKIFAAAQKQPPQDRVLEEDSLSFRLSLKMSTAVGKFCAHEIAVCADVLLIIGLLVASSVMGWNTTGQLVSNVPPSIIESFLMIILLPGHNFADTERRVQMDNFYDRRLDLLDYVHGLSKSEKAEVLQVVVEEVDSDEKSETTVVEMP